MTGDMPEDSPRRLRSSCDTNLDAGTSSLACGLYFNIVRYVNHHVPLPAPSYQGISCGNIHLRIKKRRRCCGRVGARRRLRLGLCEYPFVSNLSGYMVHLAAYPSFIRELLPCFGLGGMGVRLAPWLPFLQDCRLCSQVIALLTSLSSSFLLSLSSNSLHSPCTSFLSVLFIFRCNIVSRCDLTYHSLAIYTFRSNAPTHKVTLGFNPSALCRGTRAWLAWFILVRAVCVGHVLGVFHSFASFAPLVTCGSLSIASNAQNMSDPSTSLSRMYLRGRCMRQVEYVALNLLGTRVHLCLASCVSVLEHYNRPINVDSHSSPECLNPRHMLLSASHPQPPSRIVLSFRWLFPGDFFRYSSVYISTTLLPKAH